MEEASQEKEDRFQALVDLIASARPEDQADLLIRFFESPTTASMRGTWAQQRKIVPLLDSIRRSGPAAMQQGRDWIVQTAAGFASRLSALAQSYEHHPSQSSTQNLTFDFDTAEVDCRAQAPDLWTLLESICTRKGSLVRPLYLVSRTVTSPHLRCALCSLQASPKVRAPLRSRHVTLC